MARGGGLCCHVVLAHGFGWGLTVQSMAVASSLESEVSGTLHGPVPVASFSGLWWQLQACSRIPFLWSYNGLIKDFLSMFLLKINILTEKPDSAHEIGDVGL